MADGYTRKGQQQSRAQKLGYTTVKREASLPEKISGNIAAFSSGALEPAMWGAQDEVIAGIKAPFSDKDFGQLRRETAGDAEYFTREYPTAANVGRAIGTVAGMATGQTEARALTGAAKMLSEKSPAIFQMFLKAPAMVKARFPKLYAMFSQALGGATGGALSAEEGQRGERAVEGAMAAPALGAAFAGARQAIPKVLRSLSAGAARLSGLSGDDVADIKTMGKTMPSLMTNPGKDVERLAGKTESRIMDVFREGMGKSAEAKKLTKGYPLNLRKDAGIGSFEIKDINTFIVDLNRKSGANKHPTLAVPIIPESGVVTGDKLQDILERIRKLVDYKEIKEGPLEELAKTHAATIRKALGKVPGYDDLMGEASQRFARLGKLKDTVAEKPESRAGILGLMTERLGGGRMGLNKVDIGERRGASSLMSDIDPDLERQARAVEIKQKLYKATGGEQALSGAEIGKPLNLLQRLSGRLSGESLRQFSEIVNRMPARYADRLAAVSPKEAWALHNALLNSDAYRDALKKATAQYEQEK